MAQSKLHIFHQDRTFSPFQSALGRFSTKFKGDWLRGENYYILYAMAVAMVLMFANQIAWTFVKDAVVTNPTGAIALWYWAGQLIGIAGFILLCLVGFRKALTITFDKMQLNVVGDDIKQYLDYDSISEVKVVDPIEYHRVYRPYVNSVRVFNKIFDKVIILRAKDKVYNFSFARLDHDEFLKCINTKLQSGIVIPESPETTFSEIETTRVA